MAELYADADPDEIVNLGPQPITLRTAVRMRVAQRDQPGASLMRVFRDVGKTPACYETADFDALAEVERFL